MEDKLKAFVEQRRTERIARQEARIEKLRELNLKKYNKESIEEKGCVTNSSNTRRTSSAVKGSLPGNELSFTTTRPRTCDESKLSNLSYKFKEKIAKETTHKENVQTKANSKINHNTAMVTTIKQNKSKIKTTLGNINTIPKPDKKTALFNSNIFPNPDKKTSLSNSNIFPKPNEKTSLRNSNIFPKPNEKTSIRNSNIFPKPGDKGLIQSYTNHKISNSDKKSNLPSAGLFSKPNKNTSFHAGLVPKLEEKASFSTTYIFTNSNKRSTLHSTSMVSKSEKKSSLRTSNMFPKPDKKPSYNNTNVFPKSDKIATLNTTNKVPKSDKITSLTTIGPFNKPNKKVSLRNTTAFPKPDQKQLVVETVCNKREPLTEIAPVRRSISAIYLKKISDKELPNCIKRWNSVKRVYSNEGIDHNYKANTFGTPEPNELRRRLLEWLNKRGKSLTSYHHLQCFGLHHLHNVKNKPKHSNMNEEDDENKENDPDLSSEDVTPMARGDNFSYRAHNVNDLLFGALQDLMQLTKEGFDPDQGGRWLRVISDQFPTITETSLFWDCRAIIAGSQQSTGDNDCTKQPMTPVGTPSVARLMEKFSHLKITSTAEKAVRTPKHVDAKNAFSSTYIKFAIQQSKSKKDEFTVTPVRRSNRLSVVPASPRVQTPRTPFLQICSSTQQIDPVLADKIVFVPNKKIPPAP